MPFVKRIEALAECIGFLNGAHNPESRAFQLRNPGMCKVFSFSKLNKSTDDGYRIFTSIIGGMRFLHQDLLWKCSGQTRAKSGRGRLNPNSPLKYLLKSFKLYHETVDNNGDLIVSNESTENIMKAVDYLNRALQPEEQITEETELRYFLEGNGE